MRQAFLVTCLKPSREGAASSLLGLGVSASPEGRLEAALEAGPDGGGRGGGGRRSGGGRLARAEGGALVLNAACLHAQDEREEVLVRHRGRRPGAGHHGGARGTLQSGHAAALVLQPAALAAHNHVEEVILGHGTHGHAVVQAVVVVVVAAQTGQLGQAGALLIHAPALHAHDQVQQLLAHTRTVLGP